MPSWVALALIIAIVGGALLSLIHGLGQEPPGMPEFPAQPSHVRIIDE